MKKIIQNKLIKILLIALKLVYIPFLLNGQTPSNDYIGNAQVISQCGISFTTTNLNATSNYSVTQSGCGTYNGNLDCNNTTSHSGAGDDVTYTVENDIWYVFCPTTTGTWNVSITPSNCVGKGFQYSIFQGTPTNLHTRFVSMGGANPANGYTTTQNSNITITSTTNCIYLQIDGYAGATCDFSVVLTPPAGICALPINIISFKVKGNDNFDGLFWDVTNCDNCESFVVEASFNGVDFKELITINVYNKRQRKFSHIVYNKNKYYRIKMINQNTVITYTNVQHVIYEDIELPINFFDLMGSEINNINDYKGVYFEYYENGFTLKKIK
jgi:hypothetical protein